MFQKPQSRLEKILSLAARTSSPVFVYDPATGDDKVILSVDAYEQLVRSGEPVLASDNDMDMDLGMMLENTAFHGQFEGEDEELDDVEDNWEPAADIIAARYGDVTIADAAPVAPFAPAVEESEPQHIPVPQNDTKESDREWDEEEFSDQAGPVFYEEPIS